MRSAAVTPPSSSQPEARDCRHETAGLGANDHRQAAAEYKVPAKYKGYTAGVGSFGGAKGNTQAVYDELRK